MLGPKPWLLAARSNPGDVNRLPIDQREGEGGSENLSSPFPLASVDLDGGHLRRIPGSTSVLASNRLIGSLDSI